MTSTASRREFITGITGQDGSNLTERPLEQGYDEEPVELVRRTVETDRELAQKKVDLAARRAA